MQELPKLMVEIEHFDYIKHIDKVFFWGNNLVIVEGRVITSYEELVELAQQEPYKDKEFLEVKLEPIIGGG